VSSDTFCAIQLEGQPKNQANGLTWEAFKGYPLDSQLMLRKAGSTFDRIARLGGKDSSFVDTPLPCNQAQTYKLKAFEQGGSRTTLSDTIRLTPFDTVAPAAPAIRSFSILGPDSARLRWQLSDSNVTRYELWLRTPNTSWQNRDTVGVQTRYTYSGLNTTDSQYCARLVAIDSCAANRSAFSDVHCAMQLTGQAGNLENRLSWKAYQGFSNTDYVIQKKQNGRFQDLATVTDTSFTDTTNISCNVPETYRIQALNNSSPDSAYSDTITLTPFDTLRPPVHSFAMPAFRQRVRLRLRSSGTGNRPPIRNTLKSGAIRALATSSDWIRLLTIAPLRIKMPVLRTFSTNTTSLPSIVAQLPTAQPHRTRTA
jgi:phage terminase large subunit-like protein